MYLVSSLNFGHDDMPHTSFNIMLVLTMVCNSFRKKTLLAPGAKEAKAAKAGRPPPKKAGASHKAARPPAGGKKKPTGWREPTADGAVGRPSLRASTKARVEQAEQHRELKEQVCSSPPSSSDRGLRSDPRAAIRGLFKS